MARQTSFGEALAHARERKGLDLSTAARKLRIRPDILRAIEEGDFARMPPRGYTSNMVGAYARLVGLNPTEVTRAYREEVYQFETGRRPASNRRERPRDAGRTVALPSSRDRGSSRGSYRDDYAGSPRSGRSGLGGSSARTGRTAPQPQYTNLVQGRQAPGIAANIGSYLPLIIVGAIIVGLLVLVIVLAFGNRAAPESDVPTVPISGMQNPAGTDTGAANEGGTDATAPTQQPVAPTSAKFSYNAVSYTHLDVYKRQTLEGLAASAAPGTCLFYAPNFTTGAVLMMEFAKAAAPYFPEAEVIEYHHCNKKDAPSGTAVRTAEIIAEARAPRVSEAPGRETEIAGAEGARGALINGVPVHSVRSMGCLLYTSRCV